MKVLVTGAFPITEEEKLELSEIGLCVEIHKTESETVITPELYDMVVCNSLFSHNPIENFTSLKFIQITSAGMDRLPMDYIERRGIALFNARGVYSIPAAETIVLKVLEIYKKSKFFHRNQETHRWEKSRELFELPGRTAVIVGYGNIGRETALRLAAFGVRIIAVDIYKVKDPLVSESFLISDLVKAVEKSDILILTLPLTEKTRHLIDRSVLEKLIDGAAFINTSRGSLVKEADLEETLREGRLLGAALDVFETEPLPSDSPLWNFDNVYITPHNAFVSDKNHERMFKTIKSNVKDFMTSQKKV